MVNFICSKNYLYTVPSQNSSPPLDIRAFTEARVVSWYMISFILQL